MENFSLKLSTSNTTFNQRGVCAPSAAARRWTSQSRCPIVRFYNRSGMHGFFSNALGSTRHAAFTLIELLVVIAIIALLTGILVPSLAKARQLGKQTREISACKGLMAAYLTYTNDNRGNVMPGYAAAAMVNLTPAFGERVLVVVDDKGEQLSGQEARRYPWRIAPYLGYNFKGLYDDENILSRYQQRSDYLYVVSLSPSMGINADFVGGKGEPGVSFTAQAAQRWGRYFTTRIDEPRDPSGLLVFASARGVDPDGGKAVAGFHMIDSPRFNNLRWAAGNGPYRSANLPSATGGVDFRWAGNSTGANGKAAISWLDGHATVSGIEELRDMRKWADKASTTANAGPDWQLP